MEIKKRSFIRLMICIGGMAALHSCSDKISSTLFKSRYPHLRYEQQLRDAGLGGSILYSEWLRAAGQSLAAPQAISIPYQEQGYMAADRPEAAGFVFDARNGERLQVEIGLQALDSPRFFIDLFEVSQDTGRLHRHLHSADTGTTLLEYDIRDNGQYLLRIQPELLAAVSYNLRITAGPSLENPVAAAAKQHIGSFFGDGRDAGVRRHEGIDIFAKSRTPLIAAADGVISRAGTNNLGGKVLWLRPEGRSVNLYYAHLDSQLVTSGQRVKAGDTIGLMGNTGNARTTPAHLHFGIYAAGGAVDPLPFVRPGKSIPPNIVSNAGRIGDTLRARVSLGRVALHTPLRIEAALQHGYRVILPDFSKTFIAQNQMTTLSRPVRSIRLKEARTVYALPDTLAASMSEITTGARVNVLADYQGFYLLDIPRGGWIMP